MSNVWKLPKYSISISRHKMCRTLFVSRRLVSRFFVVLCSMESHKSNRNMEYSYHLKKVYQVRHKTAIYFLFQYIDMPNAFCLPSLGVPILVKNLISNWFPFFLNHASSFPKLDDRTRASKQLQQSARFPPSSSVLQYHRKQLRSKQKNN